MPPVLADDARHALQMTNDMHSACPHAVTTCHLLSTQNPPSDALGTIIKRCFQGWQLHCMACWGALYIIVWLAGTREAEELAGRAECK